MRISYYLLYISFIVLYSKINYSQSKFIKVTETQNTINIIYEFNKRINSIHKLTCEDSSQKQNLIIGIPSDNEHVISYNVSYENYKNQVHPQDSKLILIKGYLWIDDIYCLNLEIKNEYRQIKKIEIQIRFVKNIFRSKNDVSLSSMIGKERIINYDQAKYYLNKNAENKYGRDKQWINYDNTFLKITTISEELYRISYFELKKYIPLLDEVRLSNINLYFRGAKYPISIYGDEDGKFDPNDYIEFIGQRNKGGKHKERNYYNECYNEYLDRYSDTSVFWLTWNDTNTFRAKHTNSLNNVYQDTLKYYYENIHFEKNFWFDYSTDLIVRKEKPYWIENKTWNWHSLGIGTHLYNYYANDIYPEVESNIYLKTQSYASNKLNNSHCLGIRLNNYSQVYDSGYINKYDRKILSATFNSSLLNEGINTIQVVSFPTTSEINMMFFDWYEIEYPRVIRLINDSLKFNFSYIDSGLHSIKVLNVSDTNLIVWKNKYQKYHNLSIIDSILFITDTISADDYFYIISESKVKAPMLEGPRTFNNLSDNNIQADYILLTHKNFINTAEQYCAFIESVYRVKTLLVDVEDIYNEFSFGHFNPEAIKDFLISANFNWQHPKPKYLFIVGDGTYDYYRNKEKNLGSPPVFNFVPSYGAPVSDNWFVIWDTTGALIPMMNIGRIPVKTNEEFERYFLRHKEYVGRNFDDWNKRYLFFSGGLGSDPSELSILKFINDQIINNLVADSVIGGYPVHFYKTANPVSSFGPYSSSEIQNAIDSSALFISYIGHSGTQTWDNSIVSPEQLYNDKKRYPLITDFGCSTGKFAEPDVTSFAEMFITHPKGQAIAYIGNSSLGFFATSTIFPYLFYRKILQDSVYLISEAHKLAKMELLQNYGSSDVNELFVLTNTYFGDPIISLPIPQKPDIQVISSGIKPVGNSFNDMMDSAQCKIVFHNLGRVSGDSLNVKIVDEYNGAVDFSNVLRVKLPSYQSGIDFSFPLKNKPGIHKIKIEFDTDNEIDEIYENNNSAGSEFFVSASRLRLLNNYKSEYSLKDTLTILNPSGSVDSNEMIFIYGRDKNFTNADSIIKKADSFITNINLKELSGEGRLFIKGKNGNDNFDSFSGSVFVGDKKGYLINDSISFSSIELNNLRIHNNRIISDTYRVNFTVISAGFNDGKTAVINKNGQVYVPGGNVIGHHVCLFKDNTYEFVKYQRFNVYNGGVQESQNYYRFLDTLSSDYLLFIAVNDEGRVADSLKLKLHEFGSIYIDSLRFRSSWAFIGKRGAAPGSVPEKISHSFEGMAILDTVINVISSEGEFITAVIGPSSQWESINVNCSICDTSNLKISLIGLRKNGTREVINFSGYSLPEIDISNISSEEYPNIIINGKVKNNFSGGTVISSMGAEYQGIPELLIKAESDKSCPLAGEDIKIKINLFNAGDNNSGEFLVKGFIKYQDNISDTVFVKRISSLPAAGEIEMESYFSSDHQGTAVFYITADALNEVNELFEDNNIFSIPLTIYKDSVSPELDITFDGRQVFDGDFVSANPEIKIKLTDNVAFLTNDTNYVKIWLDGVYIAYAGQGQGYFKSEGPEITINYSVKLNEGEHELKVLACDAAGNFVNDRGDVIRFLISEEVRLLSLYTYPNPTADNTFFTFILTKIPDELKINVYTVSGRLIKQIIKYPPQLNTGFNKIDWDLKDDDGDKLANGVYFYKVIAKDGEKNSSLIQKMAIVR